MKFSQLGAVAFKCEKINELDEFSNFDFGFLHLVFMDLANGATLQEP